jgi:hemerythrin
MAIEWTEDLAVGSEQIDNQHKELFKMINHMLEACTQGKGKDVVDEIIGFLEEYVVTHFGTEENLMRLYNYPDYNTHKSHHEQFIKSFGELKKELTATGPGTHIVVMTNRIVVNWLNSHIRNVDKLLGAFLKNQ